MSDTIIYQAVSRVKAAQKLLAISSNEERNSVLTKVGELLIDKKNEIFTANSRDLERAVKENVAKPLIKRLMFNQAKLDSVLEGIDQIKSIGDPNRKVLEARELDDGFILKRVSCPIGVIGMIFESRPDALIQIASLCLKSANGIVLKGGSEAAETNRILAGIFHEATEACGFPNIDSNWLYLLETREEVARMLDMHDLIDLVIPRGSNSFVQYIMNNTNIPVLGHADGICHSYIHKDADIEKAVKVTKDAKCQYPAVCNALETLLVHKDIAQKLLPVMAQALKDAGVEIRGDEASAEIITCEPAGEIDWKTEYLDLVLSIRVVDSLEAAIDHIHTYGSGHTDSILTESAETAEKFMDSVDSADVMWNCSTRFADGFRYGLGAEVGISTLKIHARGPVGLEGLMTYKWKLYGSGQTVGEYSGIGSKTFKFRDLPLEEQGD